MVGDLPYRWSHGGRSSPLMVSWWEISPIGGLMVEDLPYRWSHGGRSPL